MASEAYLAKLRDPRWQKLRLQVLERDRWECSSCGARHKTLHVHHVAYARSGNPWDAVPGVLVTLCSDCHELEPERFRDALYVLLTFLGDAGVRCASDLELFARVAGAALETPQPQGHADALRDALLFYQEQRAELEKAGTPHA